ncbi:MAG TPA: hypothetical protein HPP76_00740 [Desulfuromonadales bacterium]|nr:hypothetical protein [Desulfuromonadales bacterium]
MKCPKCGYNSFESYDVCKKCSGDLSAYKQTYGITPVVLSLAAREKLAEDLRSTSEYAEQSSDVGEPHDDMFAFDLPEEPATEVPRSSDPFKSDDPFNFDDDPMDIEQTQTTTTTVVASDADPFADLLESTSQPDATLFSAPQTATPGESVSAAAPQSTPGEFDLENFSWDDTPAETAQGGAENAPDDFDSLFGETAESGTK